MEIEAGWGHPEEQDRKESVGGLVRIQMVSGGRRMIPLGTEEIHIRHMLQKLKR